MLSMQQDESKQGEQTAQTTPDRVAHGQTWVTRQDIHVDRIASGWLVLRFIDPKAIFKFVPARGYRKAEYELRFDMFEAEYTHVGTDCSFQTLSKRFGVNDRAVEAIGEIVHDIDCKDEVFARPETSGIATLIRGIVEAHDEDAARMERGNALFDDLYASFKKRRV